jgi:hypothetical protein
MSRNDREVITNSDTGREYPMSPELVALLRHRVATRYYDQPRVVDSIARVILSMSHNAGENLERDLQ